MLSSFLSMQSAMLQQNIAQANLMTGANAMLNSVSFGASQPLKPQNVLTADKFEMSNKAEETKIAVSKRLAEAHEKALAANIKRSTPHFGGLDYKA